jgi:hypothetical protein
MLNSVVEVSFGLLAILFLEMLVNGHYVVDCWRAAGPLTLSNKQSHKHGNYAQTMS